MAEISAYDPSMLVWLDETGCDKRNFVYGYALRGMTPAYTFKSWGKPKISGYNGQCFYSSC